MAKGEITVDVKVVIDEDAEQAIRRIVREEIAEAKRIEQQQFLEERKKIFGQGAEKGLFTATLTATGNPLQF